MSLPEKRYGPDTLYAQIVEWRLMDYVPRWFRQHGPLRRFYWQPEQIEHIKRAAAVRAEQLRWRSS